MPYKHAMYVAVTHGGKAIGSDAPSLPLLGGPSVPSVSSKTSYDLAALPAPQESTGLPSLTRSRGYVDDGTGSERRKKHPGRTKSILGQANSKRSQVSISEDDKPKKFNPEPLPFQSQSFNPTGQSMDMSDQDSHYSGPPLQKVQIVGVGVSLPQLDTRESRQHDLFRATGMMKKAPSSKQRVPDFWGGANVSRSKALMMYTERLQWDGLERNLESLSQRQRLQAEYDYMEQMRGLKRRREMLPHRETYNFLMGGQKVALCERFDVMHELNQLKCVMLPSKAKDLYVGKGFSDKLPRNHALNQPRGTSVKKTVSKSEVSLPASSRRANSRFPIIRLPKIQSPTNPKNKPNLAESTSKLRMPPVNLPHASLQDEVDGDRKSAKKPPSEEKKRDNESANDGDWSKDQALSSVPNTSREAPKPSSDDKDADSSIKVPNPLRGWQPKSLLGDDEVSSLQEAFSKLQTDSEGRLQFNEFKSQLPQEITPNQEKFLEEVFETSSKSGFIGENEFMSMNALSRKVTATEGEISEAYDKIDASSLNKAISQYTDLFQSVDRGESGKISHESLREILSTTRETEINQEAFDSIQKVIIPYGTSDVSIVDYLTLVPYFMTVNLQS